MSKSQSLQLLIIDKTMDAANRYISLLRTAEYVVDVKFANNENDIQKMIPSRNWDLIIAPLSMPMFPAKMLFQRLRRAERDIPVILHALTFDSQEMLEGLRLGAEDVVIEDADQHFLLVVARALKNVQTRRELRQWHRRYTASEKRAQQLITHSKHPIAIIQEGTYVYVNDAWAVYFGFHDADEMICLPVIDSILPSDKEKFIDLLKPLDEDEEIASFELEFKGIDADGDALDTFIEVGQIQFQGEPALQFTMNRDKLVAQQTDPQTATLVDYTIIQPNRVFDLVNNTLRKVIQTDKNAMLAMVKIDNFEQLREQLGISRFEQLVAAFANQSRERLPTEVTFARFDDDCFVSTFDEIAPERAVHRCKEFIATFNGELYTIEDETVQVTASAGLVILNESVTSVEKCLERAAEAIDDLRAEGGDENTIGNGVKLWEPDIHSDDISSDDAVKITAKRLLKENKFRILFQPTVALTGTPKQFYEVMLGICDTVEKTEMPEDFIRELFKTDAGLEVDKWVISETFKQLKEKRKTHPDTQLFVNISAVSYCNDKFVQWLLSEIKSSGIPIQSVIFQIREMDAARYLNQAIDTAHQIRKNGGQMALSRFGLTLNPMKILERLEVNYVKLDRLVVNKIEQGADGKKEFQKMLAALRSASENVIVPFVEKASVIPVLWQQGVQYIQGHYVSEPTDKMHFEFNDK